MKKILVSLTLFSLFLGLNAMAFADEGDQYNIFANATLAYKMNTNQMNKGVSEVSNIGRVTLIPKQVKKIAAAAPAPAGAGAPTAWDGIKYQLASLFKGTASDSMIGKNSRFLQEENTLATNIAVSFTYP